MRILVTGGGIAGIGAALALSAPFREIVVIDRDEAPPQGGMNEVFDGWERKGATQLRHSHVFLAKLYNLIRDRYPELLTRLFEAGARELSFQDGLPPPLRGTYDAVPGDRDLSILSCRRTTLEAVMRNFAESRPGVRFETGLKVRGLNIDLTGGTVPRATGLRVERSGVLESLAGDLVVDASGRNTMFPDWLAESGIKVPFEEAPAGILYYTRHYRLNDGETEPERGKSKAPGAGDLGYIKYGVFPADRGNFSITLAVPEIEEELRRRVVDPQVFDRICAALPGVERWTSPSRARPTSKVFSMGNLKSLWRHWAVDGKPLIHDFFAIGDATIRTNPLYGRGCTTGFLHAHILADILRATDDKSARVKFLASRTKDEIRPFYDAMVRQDQASIRRARAEQDPSYRPKLRTRIIKSFAEDAIVPATRGDLKVLRALMRGFHMLEGPADWLKRPEIVARILKTWATPKRLKAHLYAGELGPDRSSLLSMIGPERTASAA